MRRGSLSGAPAALSSSSTSCLVAAGDAEAAEALGEVHPRQAGVELCPEEVEAFRGRRRVAGQQHLDPAAEVLAGALVCHAAEPTVGAR